MTAYTLDKLLILDRLGDDEEIFAMMLDMYLQDVDNNCATLVDALAKGDAVTLQREVHTVKGLLATFADESGAELASALEQQIKVNGIGGVDAQIAVLQNRMREVEAVLKAELAGQA
jgi:HPt (histidine-containing phosphotransfer) domain-containing protein